MDSVKVRLYFIRLDFIYGWLFVRDVRVGILCKVSNSNWFTNEDDWCVKFSFHLLVKLKLLLFQEIESKIICLIVCLFWVRSSRSIVHGRKAHGSYDQLLRRLWRYLRTNWMIHDDIIITMFWRHNQDLEALKGICLIINSLLK